MTYVVGLVVFCACYGILAVTLDLMMGHAGIFSGGHSAFFGIGAYALAIGATHGMRSVPLLLLLGIGVAGAASLLFAIPALRSKDEVFVVASMAFAVIAYQVFRSWDGVTGGPGGLILPDLDIFGFSALSPNVVLVLALVVLALVVVIAWLITNSRFGRALRAARDESSAARAIGISPIRRRVTIVVVACGLASLGGGLYALYSAFIGPDSFNLNQAVLIAAMVVLGGQATVFGPLIGAVLLTAGPSLLSLISLPPNVLGPIEQIIYGLLLALLMIFRPTGIAGRTSGRTGRARLPAQWRRSVAARADGHPSPPEVPDAATVAEPTGSDLSR